MEKLENDYKASLEKIKSLEEVKKTKVAEKKVIK